MKTIGRCNPSKGGCGDTFDITKVCIVENCPQYFEFEKMTTKVFTTNDAALDTPAYLNPSNFFKEK